ncbi:MAG: restriction endonuclease subunit S [Deltaproteobacteria bacterium]|nr:restriction endonuclease subunit S [Deltaproteobacteria bacterium]
MSAVEGWKTGRLGELCSIEIGGTPSRSNPDFWDASKDTSNHWVSIRDLNQTVITDTAEHISDSGVKHSNVKLQNPGTVLLSFKLSIGRVAFAGVPLYTNEAIAGLNSDQINTNYLFHGLHHWDLLQGVDQAIKGATLNKEKLKKITFKYPGSLSEQTKIADILSTVDRAIEQTEALIAKHQRIKTGLMQDLLTRGIDEHGNLRSEKTHQFKNSPLGRIPVEWEIKSFGEITGKYGGILQTGPFGSQLHSYEYVADGVPVVMPQDIASNGISTANIAQITEKKAQFLTRHRMILGDLVFARRGDLSRCAVIGEKERGWLCGTGCLLMRPPVKVLSPRWTANTYRFHSSQLQVAVSAVGSTMPNLNTGILSDIKVALPSIEEQTRIESQLQAVDYGEVAVRNRLHKLRSLKAALMQDLLTGEKRVTALLDN